MSDTKPDMLITAMRAKLHRLEVTQTGMHYEGPTSIDRDFLPRAAIYPN